MLIKTTTKEVLNIVNFSLKEKTVLVRIRKDRFASSNVYGTVAMPKMEEILNEQNFVVKDTIWMTIIDALEKELITIEHLSGYEQTELKEPWHTEEDGVDAIWVKRFYLSNENLSKVMADYINTKQFIDTLYTEPVNPKIQYSEGQLIYVTQILEAALPLLNSLGIEVEEKPVI